MVFVDGSQRLASVAVLAIWAALVGSPSEAKAAQVLRSMSTREARENAVRAIPYAQLTRPARAKVSNVLSATTLYRRLPSQRIDCDPELFRFLIEHPDLVVNIWQVLGISDVSLRRVDAKHFEADDGAGTLGRIEFLYTSPVVHLIYAEGSYEGPLFGRSVTGKVLLLMRANEGAQDDGSRFVRCRLDAFLQTDNPGAGVLAKTFQPLVGAAADHNFQETAKFIAALNRAAQLNPPGMRTMAGKLEQVGEDDRREFIALTDELAVKAGLMATAGASARSVESPQTTRQPASRQPAVGRNSIRQSAETAGKPAAKVANKPRRPGASALPSSSRRTPKSGVGDRR